MSGKAPPPSDLPSPVDLWAQHYREAAARRRARGWHRRSDEPRPRVRRSHIYVAGAALFLAVAVMSLFIPH
jgi:hypothetical protein